MTGLRMGGSTQKGEKCEKNSSSYDLFADVSSCSRLAN